LEIQKEQQAKSQDDKLANTLEEAISKGAGIEDIKGIIVKEASSCRLGEILSLSLKGLRTEPTLENARSKLERHRYTFVSEPPPSDSPSPLGLELQSLQSELFRLSPYPIDCILCAVGTGELLKFVQKTGGEGFDCIYICNKTLYPDTSVKMVIDELVHTLKPGGKLYVSSEEHNYPTVITCLSSGSSPDSTEVHFAGAKATVSVMEVDYYTSPEGQELDDVVLSTSNGEQKHMIGPKVGEKCLWRKPINPAIIHHFQGRKGCDFFSEEEENIVIDETVKTLLIVTRRT
jgi:hypothetical protein